MKIVTSLSFQGQCREAFEFYAKVLGGKITAAMPYGDAPPANAGQRATSTRTG
jgi:PhnB protein